MAARLLDNGKGPDASGVSMDEEGVLTLEHQEDITPTWMYTTILVVCVVGFFFSFVWWASPSTIITTFWRMSFLGLMAVFGLAGVAVSVRLSRKERLVPKAKTVAVRRAHGARRFAVRRVQGAQGFARRRKDGMVRMVHHSRDSVKHRGASLRASGSHFREGFHGDADPNFLVKALHRFIRLGVWTYLKVRALVLFVLRIVVGILRLFYHAYVLGVRTVWGLYRFLAEPVVVVAYKTARWVVGLAYQTGRWALRVAWRVIYWLVRRWPFVYATQALEAPVRVHVAPGLCATDVFVSDFLRVKVRPGVQQTAAPVVEAKRAVGRTRRADRLLEIQEAREEELARRAEIVPAEKRVQSWREKRRERSRQAKQEKQAQKQAKLDEKAAQRARQEARKQAEAEYKKRLKDAKESGRKVSKEEKKALEIEVLKEYLGEDAVEEREPGSRKQKGDGKQEPKKDPEPEGVAKEQGSATDAEEKQRVKEEKKRAKEEAKRAKLQEKESRQEAKRERQARKQAEKNAKPVLKGRLRKIKKQEGRKPSKEEAKELEEQIVEELTAKILGREPRKVSPRAADPSESETREAGKKREEEDEPDALSRKERRERRRQEKEQAKNEKAGAKEEKKQAKKQEREAKKAEKEQAKEAKEGKEGKKKTPEATDGVEADTQDEPGTV